MSDTIATFIYELSRFANEIDILTNSERAGLLRRAASTIRNYQDQINYPEIPDNVRGCPDEIVYCLNEMARLINQFGGEEVAEAILEAVETIKACRVLLEAKQGSGSDLLRLRLLNLVCIGKSIGYDVDAAKQFIRGWYRLVSDHQLRLALRLQATSRGHRVNRNERLYVLACVRQEQLALSFHRLSNFSLSESALTAF
ncbi:hypothetical protein ABFT80_27040 [Mesorhizobium sp. SB112]|uniref:hypothetical protein n=1 Tax=Mesorhizobium sp. SB112 TaxID=3151853 RepID=UPI003267B004